MRSFSLQNDDDDHDDDRGSRLGGGGGPSNTDTNNGGAHDDIASPEPGGTNFAPLERSGDASSNTDGPGRSRANVRGVAVGPPTGEATSAGAVEPGGNEEVPLPPTPTPSSPSPDGGGATHVGEDRKAERVRQRQQRPRRPAKSYCSTVCMVPPASDPLDDASREAWAALTRARTELRDPGLYRWPPRANLLYPFAEYKNGEETARAMREAGIEGGEEAREVVEGGADWRRLALFKEDEYFRKHREGDIRDGRKGGQPTINTDGFEQGAAHSPATAPAPLPPPLLETATEDDFAPEASSHLHRPPTVLLRLVDAARKCKPFRVHLDELGCFGGAKRGVLWVYPRSTTIPDEATDEGNFDDIEKEDGCSENGGGKMCDKSSSPPGEDAGEEPLIRLQKLLQDALPFYNDQRKGGKFTPHVTLSHFETLLDAEEARERVQQWWTPVSFDVREIYVLKRVGDDGQFLITTAIPLGGHDDDDSNERVRVFHPPVPFEGMPAVEEDWVREERMKLRERRNRRPPRGRWRGRQTRDRSNDAEGGNGRGRSRSTDTPEEIAAKRAARKAKREQLERASQNQQEDRML